MKSYLDCWISTATALFSQALAGEPEFSESQPGDIGADAVGFKAIFDGDAVGSFTVVLDAAIFESPLHGDGVDQRRHGPSCSVRWQNPQQGSYWLQAERSAGSTGL